MSGSYTKASSMAMTLCRLSRSTPMVDSHVERKLPSMPLTWLGLGLGLAYPNPKPNPNLDAAHLVRVRVRASLP